MVVSTAWDLWGACRRTSRLHSPQLGDNVVIVHVRRLKGGL